MVQLKDDDSDVPERVKATMTTRRAKWPAILLTIAIALIGTGLHFTLQSMSGCPFHFAKSGEKTASPHTEEQPEFGSGISLSDTYSGTVVTKDQLSKHGQGSGTPWVSVLGHVYDVSTGLRHYGDEGTYHFFTGIDGSRAYSTGKFDKSGLTDDLSDLKPEQIGEIYNWLNVFGKKYTFLGRLEGPFFTSQGIPTSKWREIEVSLASLGKIEVKKRELRRDFPSCNSHYDTAAGSAEVWCSVKSGGVVRDWVGVPRQLHLPGERVRCACVKQSQLSDPKLQLYQNCDEKAPKCKLKI